MDGYILGLFRLIFGLFMVYEMAHYFQIDLVKNAFILPQVHLTYVDFLQPLPEPVLKIMLGIMLVCAVLITLGLLFRPACFLFGAFYSYFFLLEKSIFNNHIYLFILLSFLLGFTHADRFFSLRSLLGAGKKEVFQIPRWQVFIFQLQFAIVYFYGGLAKINPDWLFRMEPMKSMIAEFPADHPMAVVLKHDFQVPFLTYAGLIFDLAIPFLLWYKPTRKWSLIPLLFFHGSNSQIFSDIGIFPFTMIFATVLFFDTSEIPFLKKLVTRRAGKSKKNSRLLAASPWVSKFLVGFFIFQLLFPFRWWFLPNPVDWTFVANRFSWRMKSQSRFVDEFAYTIQDGPGGGQFSVEINKFINPMQINTAAHDPLAAAAVARMLARQGREGGMADPIVRAKIRVRWNGHPSAFTVNPEADLSKVTFGPFRKMEWVMPKPE
ncbi:MAG: HTTM domain-containing protein [Bacteroidetes bacterium]|nr:HTTM domain-containing protein [Bacteroidota bacterium]